MGHAWLQGQQNGTTGPDSLNEPSSQSSPRKQLGQEQKCNLPHDKTYRYDFPTVTIAHGGVALIVH